MLKLLAKHMKKSKKIKKHMTKIKRLKRQIRKIVKIKLRVGDLVEYVGNVYPMNLPKGTPGLVLWTPGKYDVMEGKVGNGIYYQQYKVLWQTPNGPLEMWHVAHDLFLLNSSKS
jgi:hypothetical protein